MRIKSALPITLVLLSLFLQTEAQVSTATPTMVIKTMVDEIMSVLRNEALTTNNKWQQISTSIKDNFDFRSMSQSLLETRWYDASPEEQRQCAEYFAQYLESVYRIQIESYANQSVLYAGEVINVQDAVVNTFIVSDSAEIPVSYKMRINDGEWTVYDMMIDGVSLMDSHRIVFYSIIQSEGIEGLFRDLQRKILENQKSGEPPINS